MRREQVGGMSYFHNGMLPYGKPVALVDLDGTINETHTREHLIPDWTGYSLACGQDEPIELGLSLVDALAVTHHIVLVTGRQDAAITETEAWLYRNSVESYHSIAMRPDKDHRPNPVVKRVFIQGLRALGLDVDVVVDDHPGVIDEVRKLGIKAILVHFEETPAVYVQDAEAWRRW